MSWVEVLEAVLLANLWPISVIAVAESVTYIAPAVEEAVFELNTHTLHVTIDPSTLSAPPHVALLLERAQFEIIAVDDTRLIAPPLANAAFPDNAHPSIVKEEEPAT